MCAATKSKEAWIILRIKVRVLSKTLVAFWNWNSSTLASNKKLTNSDAKKCKRSVFSWGTTTKIKYDTQPRIHWMTLKCHKRKHFQMLAIKQAEIDQRAAFMPSIFAERIAKWANVISCSISGYSKGHS